MLPDDPIRITAASPAADPSVAIYIDDDAVVTVPCKTIIHTVLANLDDSGRIASSSYRKKFAEL